MSLITTGLFTQSEKAKQALVELKKNGFNHQLIGATKGKIKDALTQLGMDEKKAELFHNRINRGHVMIALVTDHFKAVHAENILERFDVSDVTRLVPAYSQSANGKE